MTAHPQNMPILYRNALDALPPGIARDAWLWAIERPGMDRMSYRADRSAAEVLRLVEVITPMLNAAAGGKHDPDLMAFILRRHANWHFGGNVTPAYVVQP